jgi:hypothetical protein
MAVISRCPVPGASCSQILLNYLVFQYFDLELTCLFQTRVVRTKLDITLLKNKVCQVDSTSGSSMHMLGFPEFAYYLLLVFDILSL